MQFGHKYIENNPEATTHLKSGQFVRNLQQYN